MTQHIEQNPPIKEAGDQLPIRSEFRCLTPFKVMITRPDEVEEYLTSHPDLRSVLEGICDNARKAFGPSAQLALQMYNDPEYQDRFLTLYVRLDRYESGILDRIEAVTTPLAAQLDASSGHLLVTTDFRQPQG
jgi:hypothetical protein